MLLLLRGRHPLSERAIANVHGGDADTIEVLRPGNRPGVVPFEPAAYGDVHPSAGRGDYQAGQRTRTRKAFLDHHKRLPLRRADNRAPGGAKTADLQAVPERRGPYSQSGVDAYRPANANRTSRASVASEVPHSLHGQHRSLADNVPGKHRRHGALPGALSSVRDPDPATAYPSLVKAAVGGGFPRPLAPDSRAGP